jgi:sec-independent protein translocase protein TatC
MARPKSKDLFDDSVMTFGEHLEELRTRLIRAILGLVLAMAVTLVFGEQIIVFIREPVDRALEKSQLRRTEQKLEQLNITENVEGYSFFKSVWTWFRNQFWPPSTPTLKPDVAPTSPESERELVLEFDAYEFLKELHELVPDSFPAPSEELKGKKLMYSAASNALVDLRSRVRQISEPVTLNVQEAFFTYMKVGFIAGFVVASPWIFFQLWLFVAAGLYPHEQKYVYTYLPISIGLFFVGAVFCFYGVFPIVLDFLLAFNERMKITPQIRISEYISFAVMLPLVFGISFQLPLVMLFLNRVSIFQVKDYREKRRLAILIIAIASMVLTPTGDPFTLFMMMAPLIVLYEVGIYMCQWTKAKSPFEAPATT